MIPRGFYGTRRGVVLFSLRCLALSLAILLARGVVRASWSSSAVSDAPHSTEPEAQQGSISSPGASDPVTIHLPLVMKYYDFSIPPFGITMYGSIDDNAGLQEMRELRLSWVTTDVNWSDVEPDPPTNGTHTYNWSVYDTKFANAVAADLRPIALVRNNPSWAADNPNGTVTDIGDLKAFLDALVERYDGDGFLDAPGNVKVEYWELYPEPDKDICWGHNGAEYAEMLAQVQPVMKDANPRAKIMNGGLAYDWFEDQGGPFVRSFLPDVLATGGGDYLDMVAIHYYPIFIFTISAKMEEVRDILNSYGFSDLPLICPEMGFWSSTQKWSSPEEQARRLVRMFVRGMSVDLEIMTWFSVFDFGSGTDTLGLLYPDGSPKPSYFAYQILVSQLGGAHYKRNLGTNYPEIEGHIFSIQGGARERGVIWTNPVEGVEVAQELSFPVSGLRVVGKEGTESIIQDGGAGDIDGIANGEVTIEITGSPIYVEEYP